MEFLILNDMLIAWASLGAIVCVALYIFSRISKSVERASEREHEMRKLQIQEKIHISNPKLFLDMDQLQRQFSLISMGIRGGWIPFVMMFIYSMTHSKLNADGEITEIRSQIPPVVVVIGLVIFYAFLFNRAFSITAKIRDKETEIIIESQKA